MPFPQTQLYIDYHAISFLSHSITAYLKERWGCIYIPAARMLTPVASSIEQKGAVSARALQLSQVITPLQLKEENGDDSRIAILGRVYSFY
jgi:hypothetical protein